MRRTHCCVRILAMVVGCACLYLASPTVEGASQDAASPEVRKLIDLLGTSSSTERVTAADALGNLGPKAAPAVPVLIETLGDADAWVRASAMQAIASIGPAAIPSLVEMLEDKVAGQRIRALMVMQLMGRDAKTALPALRKALGDPVPRVRELASEIIEQIDNRGAETTAVAVVEIVPNDRPVSKPNSPSATPARAAEWHQFDGPNRDLVSPETGLLKAWPEGGPKLLWTIKGLGRGYSSVAISGRTLFTMGDQAIDGGEMSQYVYAYDLQTRKRLWATRVGPPHSDGPRCTPTVDGDLLYAIGTDGDLVCLETATGKERWRKSFADDFGGRMMSVWKFSESPLVDGDRLVCTPGGEDATLVALDKRTGEAIWKCAVPNPGDRGKDGAGYSSPVVAEIAGVRQYVQLFGRGTVGVDAETGRFLWGYNAIANSVANITTPVVRGDHVFTTTSYKTGCALLHIRRDGDQFHADEVYFLGPQDFENHHGGVVLVGDHIYGGNGQNRGGPTCLDFLTGKIAWQPEPPARGSTGVLFADGHLIFRYDRGSVVLVEATPDEFRIKGQFDPPKGEGPAWAHPALNDGRLYLRHGDLLLCYDLREAE
ncbi:MAG: PQQ-binding-like beta-propeller repeat protein [Thermoguttaceae bacterium]|jgi:outer membrane protein assembly factor BamB|nr:PQQ-binding-like beta-propeller repeat protein [Thermoguttaceae bacterium]